VSRRRCPGTPTTTAVDRVDGGTTTTTTTLAGMPTTTRGDARDDDRDEVGLEMIPTTMDDARADDARADDDEA